jgi:hypothetical protein
MDNGINTKDGIVGSVFVCVCTLTNRSLNLENEEGPPRHLHSIFVLSPSSKVLLSIPELFSFSKKNFKKKEKTIKDNE